MRIFLTLFLLFFCQNVFAQGGFVPSDTEIASKARVVGSEWATAYDGGAGIAIERAALEFTIPGIPTFAIDESVLVSINLSTGLVIGFDQIIGLPSLNVNATALCREHTGNAMAYAENTFTTVQNQNDVYVPCSLNRLTAQPDRILKTNRNLNEVLQTYIAR